MNASELPLEPPEQPSITEAQSFNYNTLDGETRVVVQQRAREIKDRLQNTAQAAWEIGQRLVEVRNRLGYGLFDSWLQVEFEWSRSTAYNYIRVFETFGTCATVAQVAPSALYLLSAPSTPEEARAEALAQAKLGNPITKAKAKAIINHHKSSSQFKASKLVTINVPAETVEHDSSNSVEPEPAKPAQQARQSLSPLKSTVGAAINSSKKPSESAAANTDQSKEELLGKELEPMPSQREGDESAQPSALISSTSEENYAPLHIVNAGSSHIKDEPNQRAEQMELIASDSDAATKNLDKVGQPFTTQLTEETQPSNDEGCPTRSKIHLGEQNHSKETDVHERKSANPLAKANTEISEICNVLTEGNFSKSELSNVVEILVYYYGADFLGDLLVKSLHQYEMIALCHKCFAVMNEETFSMLEVERMKLSGLRGSAIEFLNKETSQLLNSRHPEHRTYAKGGPGPMGNL